MILTSIFVALTIVACFFGVRKFKLLEKIPETKILETDVSKEFFEKNVPEIMQKEMGRLQGRVDKLEEEKAELKKSLEEKKTKKEREDLEKASIIEKRLEKLKEKNMIIVPFSSKVKFIIASRFDNMEFFKKEGGKEFREWRGYVFRKGPENNTYTSLLVSTTDRKEYGIMGNKIIEEKGKYFPSDLFNYAKTGIIPVNIRADGRDIEPTIMIPEKVCGGAEPNENKPQTPEIKRMREIDTKDLRGTNKVAFDDLYDSLQKLIAEREMAGRKEKQSLYEKINADLRSKEAEEIGEGAIKNLAMALDTIKKMGINGPSEALELQDAKIKAKVSEGLAQQLFSRIKKMEREMGRFKDGDKVAMKKIREHMGFIRKNMPKVIERKKEEGKKKE